MSVVNLLREWSLSSRVLFGTTDSGANIKRAVSDLDCEPYNINWQPCAAHLMQLCVNSGLENVPEVKTLIDKCQDISVFFRNTSAAKRVLVAAQNSINPAAPTVTFLIHCRTRWNSKYDMANRVARLLPAIDIAMARLTEPTAPAELREIAPKAAAKTLLADEIATLRELLRFLQVVYQFTIYVSKDLTPTISTLYPTIHDLLNDVGTPQGNETVEKFRKIFVKEVQRRFNPQNIPDAILVATYLNPAVSKHPFLQGEIVRNQVSVNLRHFAKKKVILALEDMVKGQYHFGVDGHELLDADAWKAVFEQELEMFEENLMIGTTNISQMDPQSWWCSRISAFPCLTALVRVYFSIQASSVPSERLFSVAGGFTTKKRKSMKPFFFCRSVLIKTLDRFNTQASFTL